MYRLFLLLLSLVFSTNLFALYLLPNATRVHGIVSDSPLAVAWSPRNAVSFESYLASSKNTDNGVNESESDSLILAPSLFLTHDRLSFEGVLGYYKSEVKDTNNGDDSTFKYDSKSIAPALYFGVRVTDALALSLGYTYEKGKSNTAGSSSGYEYSSESEETESELTGGLSLRLNNSFFIGGGINRVNRNTENKLESDYIYPELTYDIFFIAMGYQVFDTTKREGYSFEVIHEFNNSTKASGTNVTVGKDEKRKFLVNTMYAAGPFELVANLTHSDGKAWSSQNSTTKENGYDFALDYEIPMGLYLRPLYSYEKETEHFESGKDTTKINSYGVWLGYRTAQLDGHLVFSADKNEEVEDKDVSKSKTYGFKATYNF